VQHRGPARHQRQDRGLQQDVRPSATHRHRYSP
jgi:hypothetical protein